MFAVIDSRLKMLFESWMLQHVEAGQRAQDLRMDVLQAIRYIIQGWDEVDTETIRNCWRHTGILPAGTNADLQNSSENIRRTTDPIFDSLVEALQALHLPDAMQVEEFLAIPEENVVYEVPRDDQIIEQLVDMFKEKADTEEIDQDEADDSSEIPIVNATVALGALETVYTFLLQQDSGSEHMKSVNKIEKYIREKQASVIRQTTLDQYFTK